jgi:hypothetical protein
MALKDLLANTLKKDPDFQRFQKQKRIEQISEQRDMSADERELQSFQEQRRKEQVKKQLEGFREMEKKNNMKSTILSGPNIFVSKKGDPQILKQRNMFSIKGSKGSNLFFKKAGGRNG